MVNSWEPGTQYNYGDVVSYEGVAYKIIQPHRSQGDWAPSRTPALWGRMQDQSCVQHHQEQGQQHSGYGYDQGQQQQQQSQQQYAGGNVPPPTKEEKESSWHDLSDERKKQLEIGGGIAAGAALLGGGFAAFQHHKKGQEQNKAQAWALSNWLQEAENRRTAFRERGPQGPYTWVLNHGTDIPQGAIQGGQESKGPLYIARVFYEGGVHLGKAASHFRKGAVIGYDGKEVEIDTYEILLGDPSRVRWVSVSSEQFNAQNAVEGGKESNGEPLYVAQAPYKGGIHPGKYKEKFGGACIAYGGKEEIVKQFQVLIFT